MIDITGLNDSIHENMLAYEQNEVVKAIHTASSYGQTSVVVRKRGLTHQFRASLELEGIDILDHKDDIKAKLVWEW